MRSKYKTLNYGEVNSGSLLINCNINTTFFKKLQYVRIGYLLNSYSQQTGALYY